MTDHASASVPTADETSLWAALETLDLPHRLLKELAADPDHTGELLMDFAGDLYRAKQVGRARRVWETVRDHHPDP